MEKRPCKNCRRIFTVRPQQPDQKYCSRAKCQRARKSVWQKEKMRTDSAYRENQKDAQARWHKKNPDYYKNYRKSHPVYTQKNREAQAERDRKKRHHTNGASIFDVLAKMDVSNDECLIKPGNYTLVSAKSPDLAKMDVIIIAIPSKSSSYSESSAKK